MITKNKFKNHAEESRLFVRRTICAALVIIVLMIVLVMRMINLQITNHQTYTTLSDKNQFNILPIPPTRGIIYDRNGVVLAENIPAFSLEIIPEKINDIDGTINKLKNLIPISDEDVAELKKNIKKHRRFDYVTIKQNLSEAEVAKFAVNQHDFPGVVIEARLIRYYPLGETTAHTVGYVSRISEEEMAKIDVADYNGTHYIGKIGIEEFYEDILHGKAGHKQVETDVLGRIVRTLNESPPTPGSNVYLTIDSNLQQSIQQWLEGKKASVVAIIPATGEVLAMVSTPTFDPNLFTNGIDRATYDQLQHSPERPLFNRATQGQYPPASTIKPAMGFTGLDAGAIYGNEVIYDRGWFKLRNNKHIYRDWKKGGHGRTDLHKAIVQSCDTYFYTLANKLGIDTMHDSLIRFGLGEKTGIDITNERTGVVPSSKWKRKALGKPWYPGETLIAGIGQGYMLATPLQLATMVSTIANRGLKPTPHLLKSTQLINGTPKEHAIALTPTINTQNSNDWDQIIIAMRDVVHGDGGTARRLGYGIKYKMAGKTGTAQVFTVKQNEKYDANKIAEHLRDHTLFVSFAPLEDPQIAVAVVTENEKGSPDVARMVIDKYLQGKYYVEEDS